MKIYLVYSDPCCEDDDTCSCHWFAKDLDSVHTNESKANSRAEQLYHGSVEIRELEGG